MKSITLFILLLFSFFASAQKVTFFVNGSSDSTVWIDNIENDSLSFRIKTEDTTVVGYQVAYLIGKRHYGTWSSTKINQDTNLYFNDILVIGGKFVFRPLIKGQYMPPSDYIADTIRVSGLKTQDIYKECMDSLNGNYYFSFKFFLNDTITTQIKLSNIRYVAFKVGEYGREYDRKYLDVPITKIENGKYYFSNLNDTAVFEFDFCYKKIRYTHTVKKETMKNGAVFWLGIITDIEKLEASYSKEQYKKMLFGHTDCRTYPSLCALNTDKEFLNTFENKVQYWFTERNPECSGYISHISYSSVYVPQTKKEKRRWKQRKPCSY